MKAFFKAMGMMFLMILSIFGAFLAISLLTESIEDLEPEQTATQVE